MGLDKYRNKLDNRGQLGVGVIAAGAVLLVIVLAGLFLITAPNPGENISNPVQLAHFNSYDELFNALQKAQNSGYGEGYYARGGVMPMLNEVAKSGASDAATNTQGTNSTISSSTHSTTNVQVEGVDEADIIKNDGKYIYAISNGKLNIVDAFPAESAKIISTIDLNGATPNELFISSNSDKLIVFANSYGGYYPYYATDAAQSRIASKSMSMPWGGSQTSSVIVYNISDKSNPILEKQVDFE